VFDVMLLPRRVRRGRRALFVRSYFRGTWAAWRAMAALVPTARREGVLAVYGPLAMVGLLAAWTFGLVTCFGVLQWGIAQGAPDPPSLLNQLYFSGVTFFTLGYGDVTAATRAGRVLSVFEAGVGFGFIAVVIGYLPVLYQLFARREALIIRLDARAGSPPTATALLERHAGAQGLTALGVLLAEWELWCAELMESHLSYPMLAYYRSQHDNESWLAALAAVTDACALLLAAVEDLPDDERTAAVPHFQARMTFATARLAIIEMAGVLTDVPPGATRPLHRLSAKALDDVRARLADAGLPLRDARALVRDLERARGGYEPHLETLGRRLALPVPPWVLPAARRDNWDVDAPDARALYERAEAQEQRAD
jgi:hypothetical protein